MMNSNVMSLLTLLIAALLVNTLIGPAHARDAVGNLSVIQSIDQTIYGPNCPRVEYDQRCLLDACAPDCDRR